MRIALALFVAACSPSSTQPLGTAIVGQDLDPALPARFAASATALDSPGGLAIQISNLVVPLDACEPARILAQNAPNDEANVLVLTLTVDGANVGSGTYTDTSGANATIHVASGQCSTAFDEVAETVLLSFERSGDAISGSANLELASGTLFVSFDAAVCSVIGGDAGSTCTQYPVCTDGGAATCVTTP